MLHIFIRIYATVRLRGDCVLNLFVRVYAFIGIIKGTSYQSSVLGIMPLCLDLIYFSKIQ
ncbi:hypothetical protein ANAPC1_00077 [Anaplasma phagocytophilum]|uniref:Uncharacterized protein n=1 Tax=Anaplasma phagocytophilum TaxID=948 RepID=A0AA45US67_ANAPH|nr:hypothetical protein ANAPC1_00077 [Anaplasma phagocytophilum]